MSVHYKFKSGKEAHTITFDSLHISVGDLKKAIMQQRKIGKSADLDLQITNAQTKEVYKNNSTLIPKNTSVIVARVPVSNPNYKKPWNKNNTSSSSNNNTNNSNSNNIEINKNDNFTSNTVSTPPENSEEDKIKEILTQSTKDYDPSKYVRGKGPLGPLPPNYTCYRCGKPGHYIKHCPTNNIDVKRSTGIPRSFMIPANREQKGAMITANGEYAVPIIDHDAYKEVKKEKPPFSVTENEAECQQKIEIPEDLQCSLCKNLLQDAVLIPCCGNSFCDECIRLLLLDSDNHECPTCHETNVSPDTLIPNRFLRISVGKFKNETGYSNILKKTENSIANNEKESNVQSKVVDSTLESDSTVKPIEDKNDTPVVESEPKESKDQSELNEEVKEEDDKTKDSAKDVESNESNIPSIQDQKEKEEEKSSDKKELDDDKKNENPIQTIDSESSTTNQLPVIGGVLPPPPPFVFNFNNNFPTNRFRNQIRVRSSGQPPMFTRPHVLMPPRLNQNRPTNFYHDPTAMPGFGPMNIPPPPLPPYGYGSQIRNPMFDNMYPMGNRGGNMNPMMPYSNNLNPIGPVNGRTMPLVDVYSYKYHDDYEDKLERFNRQLESRSRRYRVSRHNTRSRSRSPRSRSISSTSSHSSGRSHRSRHRSQSRYNRRRERSRSHSSHRYSSSKSYNNHRHRKSSRSPSKYDKRSDYRERSDRKHKSSKYESSYHSSRSGEKDEFKHYHRHGSSSRDKYIVEDGLSLDSDKAMETFSNDPNNVNNVNMFYLGGQVDSQQESNLIDIKLDGYPESEKEKNDKLDIDTKEGKSDIEARNEKSDDEARLSTIKDDSDHKLNIEKEDENNNNKERKDKRKEKKSRRNRSLSCSSDSSYESKKEKSRKKKDNKPSKYSTDDYETSDTSRLKNKTKHESSKSKSNDYNSGGSKSKSDKSSTNDSKHNKGLKENKNNKKSQKDESQIKEEDQGKKNKEGNNNGWIGEHTMENTTTVENIEEQYHSINEHQAQELDIEEDSNNKNLSEDLLPPITTKRKTKLKKDEVEIKIQEDYSDLESEDVLNTIKPEGGNDLRKTNNTKCFVQTNSDDNRKIVTKIGEEDRDEDGKTHTKIVKTNEQGKLLVSFSIGKNSNDSNRKMKIFNPQPKEDKLNENKLKSKINSKDKDKEKDRKSSKHSSSKKDGDKRERSKEKRDKFKDRHHTSSSIKFDSKGSKSSSSKDKKKNKDDHRSHKHHSSKKRSHRHRSRSSSSSDDSNESLIVKKKVKSAIDSSYKGHKSSSKSYRK